MLNVEKKACQEFFLEVLIRQIQNINADVEKKS